MTNSLTLDHPFTFKLATFLHWVGLSGIAAGCLWMLCLQPGTSDDNAILLGVTGVLSFLLGAVLTWLHISSRCHAAMADERAAARRERLARGSQAMRLHLLPYDSPDEHYASTRCPCCPTELAPGLWAHGKVDILRAPGHLPAGRWISCPEHYPTENNESNSPLYTVLS